jgi:capsular polysaccharide transport system permease protein
MSTLNSSKSHPPSRAISAFRVIFALMLREMSTRYGRTPGGYIWAILEPLGMIILLSIGFSLLAGSPALGTSFLLLKATGFLILQVFTVLGSQVGNALNFSKPLLRYPRVTWVDALIARFTLNVIVIFAVTAIILLGIILFEGLEVMLRWEAIVLALVMTSALGFGIGCLNCFLFMRFPAWSQLWLIITRPLFLISGVVILYEDMPPLAQSILWYNPILHLTGLMRMGFYPMYRPNYISIIFVGLCILIPMVLGLLLLRRYHRELLNR